MVKWKTVRLGDVFSLIRNGASIKQGTIEGGLPITRIETIANGTLDRSRVGFAGIVTEKYTDYYLQDGDILMSHINSEKHLGKVAIYNKAYDDEKIIHGMNLLCLRTEQIYPRYALYYFNSDSFKNQITSITKKSVNQASFTVTALKDLSFLVPPLEEQKKISSELDKINCLIAKRKAQIEKLDLLVKAKFVEMFGDPVSNPMGWKSVPLKDCIIKASNGMSRRGNSQDGNIVLRLVELQSGYINYSSPNRISLTNTEKEKYFLNNNDFLFARVNGNPEYVGRCALFKDINEPVYYNDHIIRVTFNSHIINGHFASALLNSAYAKRQLKEQIKTSAGQYTISQDGIGSIYTILPPITLQNQFADFVLKTEQTKKQMQAALNNLETLYKAKMQEYFN